MNGPCAVIVVQQPVVDGWVHRSSIASMPSCVRTFSLAEVAAMVLPSAWEDPERWLRRRLNRGEIPGYRVGRVWRMTEGDVAEFLARHRNTSSAGAVVSAPAAPAVSIIDGLSARSRARLRTS
jgi:hypothetical protein